MANPWHHAVSSAKKWGGVPEDYVEVHAWFDASKAHLADFRHRALRHHTEGIFECEREFGVTIPISSTCTECGKGRDHPAHAPLVGSHMYLPKQIPVRWIGEQHVMEDCGRIPTLADWFLQIMPLPWMNRSRPLSREQEEDA